MRPKRKLRYWIEVRGYSFYDNKLWSKEFYPFKKSASSFSEVKTLKQAFRQLNKIPDDVPVLIQRIGFKKINGKRKRVVLKEWVCSDKPFNWYGE